MLRDCTAGTGRDRIPGDDFEGDPLLAVLRIGHGWFTAPTPRRPVADLLTARDV